MNKNSTASEKKTGTEPRKIHMIDIDKIIPNCEQSRKVDEKATQHLADSIKKAGLTDSISVTPRDDKYMIVRGWDRVEAYKLLGQKRIEAVVEELTDDESAERALADNLCRQGFSSVDLEIAVSKRYDNGSYGSYRELGKAIGRTGERVGQLIESRKIRERTKAAFVSTRVIIDSKPLKTDEERKKLYKLVEEGRLSSSDVREVVSNINDWGEEVKNAVLDGIVSYSRAKEIIDSRLPFIKKLNDEVIKAGRNKKTWKKIFSEVDIDQVDIFLKLFIFAKELEPNHIQEIKDEAEQKQVVNLITSITVLLSRLLVKLEKIKKNQFENIAKYFDITIKDVELLKSSGHDYAFPWEWETSEEQKLSEKIRKIKSGGTVPLEEILDKTNRNPKSLGGG